MKEIIKAKALLESRGYIVEKLNEMAYKRSDAIDRCAGLGNKFIEHFKEVYKEPESLVVSHWCDEMNAWYHEVSEIVLKPKSKLITYTQLVDWFFTRGSSTEILFKDPAEELLYNKFINSVYQTNDVKKSFVDIGLVDEKIFNSK